MTREKILVNYTGIFCESKIMYMNRATLSDPVTLESIAQSLKAISESMITKEDAKSFVTKEDAKSFATKDDLKNFATKDDLKNFATKDDLKEFTTKDDLKSFATKDDLKCFATKAEIEMIIDQKIDELATAVNVSFNKIETRLDALEKKVDRNHVTAKGYYDYIMLHYARRDEYVDFNGRLRALERKCVKCK